MKYVECMKIGHVYKYHDEGKQDLIFIYDFKEHFENSVMPSIYEESTDLDFVIGVNIVDNRDIRKIPRKFWKYWTIVV